MFHSNTHCVRRVVLALAQAVAFFSASTSLANEATAPIQIQQFVQSVAEQHPVVRIANAELEAARLRLEAADQPSYNPELSVEFQDTDVRERSIGVSQTIDWSDRRGARTDAARASLSAAQAGHRIQMESFVRTLLTALSEYRTAVSIADLAERRVGLARRFASIAADRRRAGDLDQVSFDLAVLARSEAEMSHARATSELAARREALAGFAGVVTEWPDMPQMPPALGNMAESIDLQDLPRVVQSSAELDSATATVGLRGAERRPNPTIGLRAGRDGGEGLVRLELSVPLFVRNRYRAEVGEAIADRSAAAARLNAVQRVVRAELAGSAARYRAVRDAWQVWDESGRTSLERQIETLERLWRLGDLSATEYLIQLRQALGTLETALELEQEVWDAWFSWLEYSAGGGEWVGLHIATRQGM